MALVDSTHSSPPPPVKPRLRGWLHLVAAPTAAVFGLLLIMFAPAQLRVAAAIYTVSAIALFAISATYHRGRWRPSVEAVWRRLDHSTIFLFIAGSYTAIVAAVFTTVSGSMLLWIIWTAAVAGVLLKVLWIGAPKWLGVPIYLAMGWAAIFYLPAIWQQAGATIFVLIAAGGLFYTVGAVIYARNRPNPSPGWFGFHEIFHSCTIGGYVAHYVGIALAFGAVAAA